MWCDKCQAEVAAIASQDNQRLYCASCGNAMPVGQADSSKPAAGIRLVRPVRDARELLARWAQEDAHDPLEPVVEWLPKAASPASDSKPTEKPAAAPVRSKLRFDASHGTVRPAPGLVESMPHQPVRREQPVEETVAPQTRVETPSQQHVIHPAHQIAAPHFQPEPVSLADKSTRWVSMVGQLFAYLGVGTLTVGAVLVLMGYFGGIPGYASTGWLVTTSGQMLLMLGVVTLISGGMEQTTQEVARRIDTIGERLGRIEKATVSAGSDRSQNDGSAESK